MFRFCSLTIVFILLSCSTDALSEGVTLDNAFERSELVLDNVIACAASNKDDKQISVFFYPRPGATNFQYFETESSDVDKNDFDNYTSVIYPLVDVFNGYLMKFEVEVEVENEKWVIVSFDENGRTHLSNPIRLKQIGKPTEYLSQNVTVEAMSGMPTFSWKDGRYSDTKIYFQVISDAQNNLISGTYTFDRFFQYYVLDNVVLNITKGTPDVLNEGNTYNFTLMGVSEDNWVNMIAEKRF